MSDTCPDCDRPKTRASSAFYRALSRPQRLEFCVCRQSGSCQSVTIAQLRARIAELEAERGLNEAERELFAAMIRWCDYDETHDPKVSAFSMAPFVGFRQALGRYREAERARKASGGGG